MHQIRFACAAITVTALAAAPASAQPQPLPPRTGLELGFGVQGGKMFCESEDGNICNDFTEAGGLNLNASYFVSPTLGITADGWGMAHTEGNYTIAHYINTIGVKFRPVPILTLQVGIGDAHITVDYHGVVNLQGRSDDAFAIMGSAALDVLRGRRFALSIELRAGNGFYGDQNNNDKPDFVGRNVGVGAGLTWFGF